GISFIDSMGIPICHNKRAKRNKVFRGLSGWGKSSVDWYFGFKLHLIINEQGELLAFQVTPGNIDDRKPVPTLAQNLWGRLFGDKGYISKSLFQELLENDVKLITPFKKNMNNKLVELWEKLMLRKRALIETVNDQLQNISQVVHSRHRSISNFMVNIISGLIAYTWQDKKPSLKLDKHEVTSLPALLI
ncbi:MAG: IS982 family transposase, partial [Dolichospermum sp.]